MHNDSELIWALWRSRAGNNLPTLLVDSHSESI